MADLDRWAAEAFSAQEFEDPALEPGPAVSIRSLKAAAKRRKRLWITTAIIGLLLGASLHLLLPSKVAAVTRLYLVEPAGSDPSVAITNDVSLLGTRTVAEAATVILHLDPQQATIAYKGSAEGSSILAIKASGATATEAITRTNAVAKAFLQVRAQLQNEATNAELSGLQAQITSLETAIQRSAVTDSEVTQRSADIAQKTTLTSQVARDQATQAAANRNSVVLDPAYIIPLSAKKTAVKDGLSGLVAGLALGLTIVVIGELMSDRVRSRADVAAALGVPVELSVGRLP